jgi:hypothetical protein
MNRKKRSWVKPSVRQKTMALTGGLCWFCGTLATSLDHLIPRSRGGVHRDNIVPACKRCNKHKKDQTLEEFRIWLTTDWFSYPRRRTGALYEWIYLKGMFYGESLQCLMNKYTQSKPLPLIPQIDNPHSTTNG